MIWWIIGEYFSGTKKSIWNVVHKISSHIGNSLQNLIKYFTYTNIYSLSKYDKNFHIFYDKSSKWVFSKKGVKFTIYEKAVLDLDNTTIKLCMSWKSKHQKWNI